MNTLLSLTLNVIASLVGGNGTADETESKPVVSYKPKGPNGEMIQVYENK
ncbi:hypothetical protein PULV_a4041 [Pseudoalteromonas ulvae UL12]|nr:hypothetical protein [Pseudoalteromonas ulvae]MBE0362226.1 hypothetical protein [Pseudoalteromonas ulvae UL12]